MLIALLTRFPPPFDPPAYVVFYTSILVIVFGTAAYLALRKMKDKKRILST